MGHRHMSEPIHRGVIVKLSGETLTGGESFGVSDGRHNLRACPKKPYAYHCIFDRRTPGAIEAVLREKVAQPSSGRDATGFRTGPQMS
jgi:hypothetical protein